MSVDRDWFFTLVRTGFAQRRKMLRRARSPGSVDADGFERAGVSPEARAEELDVYAWGLLASHAGRVATRPTR